MDTYSIPHARPIPMPQTPHSLSGPPTLATAPAPFSGREWQQVLARDASADGRFVYAVRSTKIYCRPSCPSRRPTRRNVTFFPTAEAAERAGYRACKRCQPEIAAPRPDPQTALVAAATTHLALHAGSSVPLDDLAHATGANRLALLRAFRRVLGVTPSEYARAQRVTRFKDSLHPTSQHPAAPPAAPSKSKDSSLAQTSTPRPRKPAAPSPKRITDAIYEAGFGSSSRLYESTALGMTPRTMRAGGAGLVIRYTTAASPLGRMLVAATPAGICAITFGRDDAELLADLRARFNKAQLVPARGNTGWLSDAVAFVVSQTTEHPLAATFPLDVRATAFQQRVWKALREIPRGETRSYTQIARHIGHPKAVRAVGAAIGANPIAVAVPCHRVIGRDGSLTGYHWGLERKRKLLAAESLRDLR